MNPANEERIQIVSQLNSIYSNHHRFNRFQVKQIKNLRWWGLLNYGLAIVLLFFVIFLSLSAYLNAGYFAQKWDHSALLVFMTLSLSIRGHYTYVEWLLLNHLKELKQLNFTIENHQNKALKELLNGMKNHRFKPYWIIIPSIFILFCVILYIMELNPYWKMFPLPVLIVCFLLLWNLNNQLFLVKQAINNVKPTILFT